MGKRDTRTTTEIARDVLKLLDGYMSAVPQHVLHGWDGGLMTVAELREHAQGAIKLLEAAPPPAALTADDVAAWLESVTIGPSTMVSMQSLINAARRGALEAFVKARRERG
jgi:hypothetical protein